VNARIVERVTFHDLQQVDNPMNGTGLESAAALAELFRSLNNRKPFLFELRGDNGFTLTVGFGDCGCVQYNSSNGSPPYLVAVAKDVGDASQFVEFLAGNTLTPIPRRFCLPIGQIEKIAVHFLASGGRSRAVTWEEI
jgi:hypothetical protein